MKYSHPWGTRCRGIVQLTYQLFLIYWAMATRTRPHTDRDLVTDRREGRWMYYTLNPETLNEAAEWLDGLASAPSAAERKASCC